MEPDVPRSFSLPEALINLIENTAYRLAQKQSGKVRVNDLACELPLSLEILEEGLSHMLRANAISTSEEDGLKLYIFPALSTEPSTGPMDSELCVACQERGPKGAWLCRNCERKLRQGLQELSAPVDWTEVALQQHALLHLASQHPGPISPSFLAANTPYTFGKIEGLVEQMCQLGYAKLNLDQAEEGLFYDIPTRSYPEHQFKIQQGFMEACRSAAVSTLDQLVAKVAIKLGLLVLFLLGLSLMRITPRMIVISFLCSTPLLIAWEWRKYKKLTHPRS